MLGRRPLAQHGHQRRHEHHEQHRAGGPQAEHEDRQQRGQRGQPVEQQLALEGQRPQPRAHQDVTGLAQVAREEDDDPELGELSGLELDRAELYGQERAVDLLADAGQARHHQQSDAARRDQVAVALEHVVIADRQDRGAEEGQPDHEPLGLLACQLGIDPVDQHQAHRGQERGQREHVGIGVGQPRADEEVGEHAQAEKHGAVGERRVLHVLGPGGQHRGEPRHHEERHRKEAEQLPRPRGHQPELRLAGSSWPRSSDLTRSTASSRPRHSWSSTRARRRGRDGPRRHAARVLLLVEIDSQRELVRHAPVDRDQARVVGAHEVDLAAEGIQAGDHRGHEGQPQQRRERRRANAGDGGCSTGGLRAGGAAGLPAAGLVAAARPAGGAAAVGHVVDAELACDRLLVAGQGPVGRAVLAQPEQHDRDVVLAAALVGSSDERIGGGVEVVGAAQDRAHLVVRDHRGEPVRAEQEEVARAAGDGIGVHLHVGLGAQRPGDDRALRMVLGRLRRDLPAALELGHQRVVARELLELAVAEAVGAAVAHVAEADLVAVHLGGGQRRAHAAPRLVGHRQVVDARGWPPAADG